MVKTVIFDFGGVYFTDGTKYAIQIIADRCGISMEDIARVFSGRIGTSYRIGEIKTEDFWMFFKEKLGIDISSKELSNIWLTGYRPRKGVTEIINRLFTAGYELMYLSDNVQERVDYLSRKYNFLEKFKDGVFSYMVGTRKPDPKIYQMVLNKTNSTPKECVYIDNKVNLLKPAKELGMNTIHFVGVEHLERDLNVLGLHF